MRNAALQERRKPPDLADIVRSTIETRASRYPRAISNGSKETLSTRPFANLMADLEDGGSSISPATCSRVPYLRHA